MSYPEPRYFGDTGEVRATFRRVDAAPELTFKSGGTVSYLATQESTSNEYGLYRWDFAAAPSGPGTHFHKGMSEAFFILSGTVRLFNGEKWVEANSGDYLYVPPGGLHAFRNESGEKGVDAAAVRAGRAAGELLRGAARGAGSGARRPVLHRPRPVQRLSTMV
jgi:mannose-6-phosphate isomerase-like protein (cupin superfamily)